MVSSFLPLSTNHSCQRRAGSLRAGLCRRARESDSITRTGMPASSARRRWRWKLSRPKAKGIAWPGWSMKCVGAAVTAGGDDDLRGTAAGGGHCAHILGCQVGHIGGQDQNFGCAAGGGVASSLGQGRVEQKFRIGVSPAAGRWRQPVRGRSAVGERAVTCMAGSLRPAHGCLPVQPRPARSYRG